MSIKAVAIIAVSVWCILFPHQPSLLLSYALPDLESTFDVVPTPSHTQRLLDDSVTDSTEGLAQQLKRLQRENVRLNSLVTDLKVERDTYRIGHHKYITSRLESLRAINQILEYIQRHIIAPNNITPPIEFVEYQQKIRSELQQAETQAIQ